MHHSLEDVRQGQEGQVKVISAGLTVSIRKAAAAPAIKFWCVSRAPLGFPVVPEVLCMFGEDRKRGGGSREAGRPKIICFLYTGALMKGIAL